MAVNLVLQGKGGVGKSLISSIIAQYFLTREKEVLCIDTDPVNSTLAGYKGFKVERLELMDGNRLDISQFDQLMQTILDSQDKEIIIDNGASSFIPLSSYLIENDAISVLSEMGVEVNTHTVITGGQAMDDTMTGLASLLSNMEGVNIFVWLNHYFGKIEKNGMEFYKMKIYKNNIDRIKGIVNISQQSELFGKDINEMLEQRMTFHEAIQSDDFNFMAKNRLKKTKESMFEQLDEIGLIVS